MAPTTRDLLPECNDAGLDLVSFQADWCARCLNLECNRSLGGKSKFEARVSTWEERLFKNPPRMSPDDPRFEKIAAQKFITIDVGRTPGVSSAWVDPTDLVEPAAQAPEPVATKPPVATSVEAPAATVQKDTGTPASASPPIRLALGNAPDQSGKILPSHPSASISKRDPWASPLPSDTNETIVTPGASVKLRGSGV
jgi:hypothetical protein